MTRWCTECARHVNRNHAPERIQFEFGGNRKAGRVDDGALREPVEHAVRAAEDIVPVPAASTERSSRPRAS